VPRDLAKVVQAGSIPVARSRVTPSLGGVGGLQVHSGRFDSDWRLQRACPRGTRHGSSKPVVSVRLRAGAPREPGGPRRKPPKLAVRVRLSIARQLPSTRRIRARRYERRRRCSTHHEGSAGQPEMAARSHKPSQWGATPQPATNAATFGNETAFIRLLFAVRLRAQRQCGAIWREQDSYKVQRSVRFAGSVPSACLSRAVPGRCPMNIQLAVRLRRARPRDSSSGEGTSSTSWTR
jgi:hypothetical protein